MFGDAASPGQLRHSESNQSINRKMWDSSDPTRNPAPLPLPDCHSPLATVRTQSKVSAAHKRIATTNSSRSLSQLAQDGEAPQATLYDLVNTIHTNLEILMKRSQNNARDLGRLRGDVKNPQAIEEIKRILQESSSMQSTMDIQDPGRRQELDLELANKVDALLKVSMQPADRPSSSGTDNAIMAQLTMLASPITSVAETNSQVLGRLDALQSFMHQHLPIHIPEPPAAIIKQELAPAKITEVMIDTKKLETTVDMFNVQILSKVDELQKLDAILTSRRIELNDIEHRTKSLQQSLDGLVSQISSIRSAEESRKKMSEEHRAREKNTAQSKKPRKALMPLAPHADRRIVSLSNVAPSPNRTKTNSPALAAPLLCDSPFSTRSVVAEVRVTQDVEPGVTQHRPMPMSLRTPPKRKPSWSRRVSQIFQSGNKENSSLYSVDEKNSAFNFPLAGTTEQRMKSTIGRSAGAEVSRDLKGSMRSFRSFSNH